MSEKGNTSMGLWELRTRLFLKTILSGSKSRSTVEPPNAKYPCSSPLMIDVSDMRESEREESESSVSGECVRII